MTTLIINGQAPSTYVRTARMCCIEAGVDHELRPIADGIEAVLATLKSDAYREKHPFGRMPTLEDGDVIVFETSAIARYVSEKYGGGKLVPAEFREAIRMEQWVSAANCYVIPDTVQKFVAPLVFQPEPDLEQIENDKPLLRAHYEILNRALEGRTVFAGDDVSIADLLLAPPLHMVGMLPGGMSLFEGLDNLGRWWGNISSRKSFTETVADMPGRKEQAA